MTINKWGGFASFLLAASFVAAPLIYLTGNLQDAIGVLTYGLADFLYGPILSASLITVTYALRERIGELVDLGLRERRPGLRRSRRAGLRTRLGSDTNRHYHLTLPALNLENSTTVLIVWTTLVAGVNAIGFHFLGWAFVLLGSSGWTSGLFPRLLNTLYFLAGVLSLFVYLFPELEGLVLSLGAIISVWQGISLWKAGIRKTIKAG